MEMKLECGNCEQHILLDDSSAGQTFSCPSCGHSITAQPAAPSAPPPAVAPPLPAREIQTKNRANEITQMQEQAYYEDQVLRVTASEIRCKHATIRTDAVTSVSMASARPLKWAPLFLLVPLFPIGFMMLMTIPIIGNLPRSFFGVFFVGMLPFACLSILASFIRISRIFLQTSGGPVALAIKVQLTDPSRTLTHFQTVKDSIEQAMRAARAR